MANGTVFHEDDELLGHDSDDKEDWHGSRGEDTEASEDSGDEDRASNYKLQRPDASLLSRAVTKLISVHLVLI